MIDACVICGKEGEWTVTDEDDSPICDDCNDEMSKKEA